MSAKQGDTQTCPDCDQDVAWDETASPHGWRHVSNDSRWCELGPEDQGEPNYPQGATDPRRQGKDALDRAINGYVHTQELLEANTARLLDLLAPIAFEWARYVSEDETRVGSAWVQTHREHLQELELSDWALDREIFLEYVSEDTFYLQDDVQSYSSGGFRMPRGFAEDRQAWIEHDQKDAHVRRQQHLAALNAQIKELDGRIAELDEAKNAAVHRKISIINQLDNL